MQVDLMMQAVVWALTSHSSTKSCWDHGTTEDSQNNQNE